MIRWLRSLFAWRAIRNSGVWVYLENNVTSQRKAVWLRSGYQPLDISWLRPGDRVVGPQGQYIVGHDSEFTKTGQITGKELEALRAAVRGEGR